MKPITGNMLHISAKTYSITLILLSLSVLIVCAYLGLQAMGQDSRFSALISWLFFVVIPPVTMVIVARIHSANVGWGLIIAHALPSLIYLSLVAGAQLSGKSDMFGYGNAALAMISLAISIVFMLIIYVRCLRVVNNRIS